MVHIDTMLNIFNEEKFVRSYMMIIKNLQNVHENIFDQF